MENQNYDQQPQQGIDWDSVLNEIELGGEDVLLVYQKETPRKFKLYGRSGTRTWFTTATDSKYGKPRALVVVKIVGVDTPKVLNIPLQAAMPKIIKVVSEYPMNALIHPGKKQIGMVLSRTGEGADTKYILKSDMANEEVLEPLPEDELIALLQQAKDIVEGRAQQARGQNSKRSFNSFPTQVGSEEVDPSDIF